MGGGGLFADGEQALSERIRYGIPDVLGRERSRYVGKRVLVIGSGHSAIGAVLGLSELAAESSDTLVAWGVRRKNPEGLWGGGGADELQERGALGTKVHASVHSEKVTLLTSLTISKVVDSPEGIEVFDPEGRSRIIVDEIVVAAGSRPELSMYRELRIDLDPVTESTRALGPLIDPNHHSCASVPPHGAAELAHAQEPNFYIVGMKSYGRAPTFLLRTGYERSFCGCGARG